jgi:hypothetical protein
MHGLEVARSRVMLARAATDSLTIKNVLFLQRDTLNERPDDLYQADSTFLKLLPIWVEPSLINSGNSRQRG